MAEASYLSNVFLKIVGNILIFSICLGLLYSIITFHGHVIDRSVDRIEMDLGEQLLRDRNLMLNESGLLRPGIINGTILTRYCKGGCDIEKLDVNFTSYEWGVNFLFDGKEKSFGSFEGDDHQSYPIFVKDKNKIYPGRMEIWVGKRA
ncbi:MAG: hypothetical protein ABEK36_01120 [Candidatus Aenigmatarchaeota archaeon]